MTAAELAAGYEAYTDQEELRSEVARRRHAAAEPTTTVLTTSIYCGDN